MASSHGLNFKIRSSGKLHTIQAGNIPAMNVLNIAAIVSCLLCTGSSSFLNIPNYFPTPVRRAGGSGQVIAFSAGLTNSTESHTPTTISFDRVFVNEGNGYNASTGVFTAPIAGTYVFIFHALTQANTSLWLDIYQNSNYMVTGYAHATNDYASSTNAVVLTLATGDDVSIRSRKVNYIYGQPDEIYSTFSGFLIFTG